MKFETVIMPGEIQEISKQIVYLTGFMGAGKSTVGELLAKKLNWKFIDTDGEIVQEAGQSVADIFCRYGEEKFRELEIAVVRRVVELAPAVIALGGGALMAAENRRHIFATGFVVYLEWDFAVLFRRIENDPTRPIVYFPGKTRTGGEILPDLFKKRLPYYRRADLIFKCETDMKPDFIAHKIFDHFYDKIFENKLQ